MAKPKNMTAEQEAEWRKWHAGECRRRYLANRETILEKQKQYREENRDELRPKKAAWNKKWREKNLQKSLERERLKRQNHKERIKKTYAKCIRKKKQQSASDQFFIMAGAAEQLSAIQHQ
jgi:hypothetical protein